MALKEQVFYAEIDPHELACRMIEAELQRPRPEGFSAEEACRALGEEDYKTLMRSASAAFKYFQEKIARMTREQ